MVVVSGGATTTRPIDEACEQCVMGLMRGRFVCVVTASQCIVRWMTCSRKKGALGGFYQLV